MSESYDGAGKIIRCIFVLDFVFNLNFNPRIYLKRVGFILNPAGFIFKSYEINFNLIFKKHFQVQKCALFTSLLSKNSTSNGAYQKVAPKKPQNTIFPHTTLTKSC